MPSRLFQTSIMEMNEAKTHNALLSAKSEILLFRTDSPSPDLDAVRPLRSSIGSSANPAKDALGSVAVDVAETSAHLECTAGEWSQGDENGPVAQTSKAY